MIKSNLTLSLLLVLFMGILDIFFFFTFLNWGLLFYYRLNFFILILLLIIIR
jgi:hypothetical protein